MIRASANPVIPRPTRRVPFAIARCSGKGKRDSSITLSNIRVAMLNGCAQRVLAPEINEATVRLLTRHGVEVVVAEGAGCCGSLTHHMGLETAALDSANPMREALASLRETFGLTDAPLLGQYVTYLGHVLRGDLGVSIAYFPAPVSEVIGGGLVWTILLAGTAVMMAFLVGTLIGIAAAWWRH